MLRASWALIVLLNTTWVVVLWRNHRRDHAWLAPFFTSYLVTDTFLFACGHPTSGGLGLITPALIGRDAWIGAQCMSWICWFVAPLFASMRLRYRVLPRMPIVIVVFIALLLSWSESFGISTEWRRLTMHLIYEPLVLIAAAAMLAAHVSSRVREGGSIDFLVFAVLWTSLLLGLKTLMLLDEQYLLMRWPAHAFFYIYYVTTVTTYWLTPRFKRWLVSS